MMNTLAMNIIKKSIFSFLCILITLSLCFLSQVVQATTRADIHVDYHLSKAQITLTISNGRPDYKYFSLHSPERLVIDIKQNVKIIKLPIKIPSGNLVKVVRTSQSPNKNNKRIVLELSKSAKIQASLKQVSGQYRVVFSLFSTKKKSVSLNKKAKSMRAIKKNALPSTQNKLLKIKMSTVALSPIKTNKKTLQSSKKVIIAIDAGHGGKDPGAIGNHGYSEKNVTLSIARKLYKNLALNPMFKPVLTRNGDYFISVRKRSDVARKKDANMLISIHADSAPNRNVRGASIWVLSNRRAHNELGNWLTQHKKQSELLGGVGEVLSRTDPYLSKVMLDLQFGHSQRVGYNMALKVIQQLKKIGNIHKSSPEHASLGVLRSPDIPSFLIEIGFISNAIEEKLLKSNRYQKKIVEAIHQGLREYFLANPLQTYLN
ncbi:N-acetylmuramoyl-L-alanine amidase AmiB [Candidatus Hartigia pinicola]|nr:N-acetylmuramoyl-L-alanine amidase AmiB [Candidatus Hartigia pinicola]